MVCPVLYIGVGILSIPPRVTRHNTVMYLYECIVYCTLSTESREIRSNLSIAISAPHDRKGYGD